MGLVIKGLLSGLTPGEKLYLLTHPHQIGTIKEAADKALAKAAALFERKTLYNGTGDAFRHCLWSAMLSRDIGPENALAFTTAHENYDDNPERERAMDLHNNSVGIEIGKMYPEADDDQLASFVLDALKKGRLTTSLPATGNPY